MWDITNISNTFEYISNNDCCRKMNKRTEKNESCILVKKEKGKQKIAQEIIYELLHDYVFVKHHVLHHYRYVYSRKKN